MTVKELHEQAEIFSARQVEMILRLRNHDKLFERIVFYDEDNVDIVFEIPEWSKNKKMRKYYRNIREGALYRVTFLMKGKNQTGGVSGDLISFTPVYLEKIP